MQFPFAVRMLDIIFQEVTFCNDYKRLSFSVKKKNSRHLAAIMRITNDPLFMEKNKTFFACGVCGRAIYNYPISVRLDQFSTLKVCLHFSRLPPWSELCCEGEILLFRESNTDHTSRQASLWIRLVVTGQLASFILVGIHLK